MADRTAGVLITLGGLGTILAVSGVCVFLVWVVIPLFMPESLENHAATELARSAAGTGAVELPGPTFLGIDEYRSIGWTLTPDGRVRSFRPDTGEQLAIQDLFTDRRPTATSLRGSQAIFGFDDGTVQLGTIEFDTILPVPDEEVPASLQELEIGESASFRKGILEKTPEKQYRLQQLATDLQEPAELDSEAGIALLDLSISTKGRIFAALTTDGVLHLARVTQRKNLLTGEVTTRLRQGTAEVELPEGEFPAYLKLAGLGDSVFLAWRDGRLVRYNTRDATKPVVAEKVDLVPEPDEQLTALAFLIGKTSLLAGDSLGRVSVWFRTRPETAETPDGSVLVQGHGLPVGSDEVLAFAPSPRSRLLAAAYADGSVRLFQVTSGEQLAEARLPADAVAQAMIISPKDDALLVLTADQLLSWDIHAPHPEITLSAIFRPVWYESRAEPEHVWQSSSATDVFEPKYGMIPLVFGTIKATVYSMLFGAPLALLAAIYTSEFLHPRVKSRVKPTIEIMASLPSVVLGFLAALVFAPLVEDIVPECLAAFATIPFAYLLGAYLWQLFPQRAAVYAARYRMVGMVLALPFGIYLAWVSGDWVERWLFAGDIKRWLDGQIGTGVGAWMIILLPLCALALAWSVSFLITPAIRRLAGHWPRTPFGLLDLTKFLAGCFATLLLAYGVSVLFDSVGWDPRGTVVDTYVQRNALVVGFIMGFAIIPIIYTISDDALSSVPESLRAGSLGAGATRWQTAIRIVVPTAMSGLFSAMMVGLGRAVGETMIVLMAAGNTAVMDWNIFNGFRTLSANIAVEMPEAVRNSTHFRLLFLAALVLFIMTFLVNTIAEIVRLRFRKRAFQL